MAKAGEFNRRYLACQILAILYADRGEAKITIATPAHLAILTDRGNRRIKSPSVSPALSNDNSDGNDSAAKHNDQKQSLCTCVLHFGTFLCRPLKDNNEK